MTSKALTPDEYMAELPEERKEPMAQLRKAILDNLPTGFVEQMGYGMIGYVVPHSIYPKGYHCTPKLPLPFLNIASQKNAITMYHLGLYGDKNLMEWFHEEFPKHSKTKLDMGKGCIRFKKPDQIPFALIGELISKVSVSAWIERYEATIFKKV